MTFQESIRSVLSKYADFNGRARRSEYWYWVLAVLLAYIVVLIVSLVVHALGIVLLVVLVLGAIVPNLAVGCRRLHDIGQSGWLQLIGLVPFVGGIILLVLYCLDSKPGPNQYGPNPKGF